MKLTFATAFLFSTLSLAPMALGLLSGCEEGAAPAGTSSSAAAAPVGGGGREKECDALRKAINDGIEKLEKMPESGDVEKDLEAQAKQLDAIADAVIKVGATDPELKKVADEYAKLRKSDAANQRAVAKAGKAGDEKKMEALEKTSEGLSKTEDQLTEKLEKLCE
jgi:hypothetical protein